MAIFTVKKDNHSLIELFSENPVSIEGYSIELDELLPKHVYDILNKNNLEFNTNFVPEPRTIDPNIVD